MRQLLLKATANVTLDANGNGTAHIGPLSPGEQWSGLTAAVRVATRASEAICSTYAGAAADAGYFCDATTWGSTGDSTTNLPAVQVGGNVFAVWTGGDPGAVATLTVTGTKKVA
jgi:hypothetical protein